MAESLLSGLAQLFTEHRIEVDEEGNDVVEQLVAANEELKTKLDEATQLIMDLSEKVEANELDDIVAEAAAGLTDTQAEKLKALAEGIKYTDVEDFKAKVATIRESIFTKVEEPKKDPVTDSINEEVVKPTDPRMKAYLDTARRLA